VAVWAFLAGMLVMLAAVIALLPWLRTRALEPLSARARWPGAAAFVLLAIGCLIAAHRAGAPGAATPGAASLDASGAARGPLLDSKLRSALAATDAPAPTRAAGSMNDAVASLEARLARGGGSDGDWELLAKSYEFLNRPQDAAIARTHRLPSTAATAAGGAAAPSALAPSGAGAAPAGAGGRTLVGEVTLAPRLKERLAAGATLFIVAKSVDSPGPPVAVIRRPAADWPVAFTLDESQAMLPGRNLSNAGRVEVEARVSKSGQAMPTSGDLRGKSPIIEPAQRGAVRITIDDVVS
jgi:hypothetical protein